MLALFFRPDRGDCRSRKMLQNAYLDVKIGFDTEENEPSKVFDFFNFSSLQRFNFDRAVASDSSSLHEKSQDSVPQMPFYAKK